MMPRSRRCARILSDSAKSRAARAATLAASSSSSSGPRTDAARSRSTRGSTPRTASASSTRSSSCCFTAADGGDGTEQPVEVSDGAEEMSHRLRHVEVVVHGPGKGVGGGRGACSDLLAATPGPEARHPVAELGQPAHRLVSGPEGRLVPLEGAAVMGAGDEQVADRRGAIARLQQVRNGPEVAEALGHLLLADGQVLAMAPDPNERLPGRRLGLGDLVLVVGEDVVDPAAVDVQALTEQRHAHR